MEKKEFTDAEKKQIRTEMGREGDIKSRASLTDEQRAEHCKKMAQIRWAKVKAEKLINDAYDEMPNINGERPFVFTDPNEG